MPILSLHSATLDKVSMLLWCSLQCDLAAIVYPEWQQSHTTDCTKKLVKIALQQCERNLSKLTPVCQR